MEFTARVLIFVELILGISGVGGCLLHRQQSAPLDIATSSAPLVTSNPATSSAPAVPSTSPRASTRSHVTVPSSNSRRTSHAGVPSVKDELLVPSTVPLSPSLLPSAECLALQRIISARYAGRVPMAWGNRIKGIRTHYTAQQKCLALTFDACGNGRKSNGYDEELISYLRQEHIPATLFISGIWADAHPDKLLSLTADPLFEIENHGLRHLPCSVNSHSAYHIIGTRDVADVVLEVEGNAEKLAKLTGRKPCLFRDATAMYDDVALDIITDLGYTVIGYSILGDAGATFSAAQVKAALLTAKPGDIIICHMNHPEGDTCAGIQAAIPLLQAQGYTFVKLDEVLPVR